MVKNKCRMVGFNNNAYDYRLIHEIIESLQKAKQTNSPVKVTAHQFYKLTEKIISEMKEDGKNFGMRESEHRIKQVDLLRLITLTTGTLHFTKSSRVQHAFGRC